ANTVQFIGGATANNNTANPNVDKSFGQAPAAETNMNQEYQISNDAHFASDDIPF
ncbi:MAG: hypothetical protein H0V66_00615, partial [Bdellovibrionales bacterium]|nr:hypothetical protein [Bdellovibrionales bacterium]